MANKKFSAIGAVLSLFIISAVTTGAVAAVNNLTAETILDHEQEKTWNAMQTVMPGATFFQEINIEQEGIDPCVTGIYEGTDESGTLIGYCVESTPNGFSDVITLVTGITKDCIVNSVAIIDASNETPGLGSRVTDDAFLSHFNGKDLHMNLVKSTAKNATDVSAVSGATYSSTGVYNGVLSSLRAVAIYTAGQKEGK